MQSIQLALKDPSILNAVVFCACAGIGQILHAVKKWTEGYQWVTANPRQTVAAIIGNMTGMFGFISTGSLDEISKIGTVVSLGIFMGLSADSVLNKGSKEVWTQEQREAGK